MPNRIAGLSIPKAGTHLLVGIFKSLGFQVQAKPKGGGRQIVGDVDLSRANDTYIYGHWRYAPDTDAVLSNAGFRKVLLIRDPRDISLSMADYIKSGRLTGAEAANAVLSALPLRRLQIMAIEGFEIGTFNAPPIKRICQGWLPWCDHDAVMFRYEDIAGRVACGDGFPEAARLGIEPTDFARAARRRFHTLGRDAANCRW